MQKVLLTFIAAVAFFVISNTNTAYAQSLNATYTLTTPSNTIAQGAEVSVVLSVNAPQKINAVQATISYPVSKLTFINVDTSGSPFSIVAKKGGGNGAVNIATGTTSPVTGEHKIATIIFKAIQSANASEITLTQPSLIVSSETHSNVFGGTTYHKTSVSQVKEETKITVPPQYLTPQAQPQTAIAKNIEKKPFLQRLLNFFFSIFQKN